jgi:hypothetical protein
MTVLHEIEFVAKDRDETEQRGVHGSALAKATTRLNLLLCISADSAARVPFHQALG